MYIIHIYIYIYLEREIHVMYLKRAPDAPGVLRQGHKDLVGLQPIEEWLQKQNGNQFDRGPFGARRLGGDKGH